MIAIGVLATILVWAYVCLTAEPEELPGLGVALLVGTLVVTVGVGLALLLGLISPP